jgi:hypothetical protein
MPDLGVLYCVAVPILLLSAAMFLSNILFTLRAQKTRGTVVGYKTSRSAKEGGGQAEIVEFSAADGKTVQFTEKAHRTRFIQRQGHTVNVLYDPNNPSRAHQQFCHTLSCTRHPRRGWDRHDPFQPAHVPRTHAKAIGYSPGIDR